MDVRKILATTALFAALSFPALAVAADAGALVTEGIVLRRKGDDAAFTRVLRSIDSRSTMTDAGAILLQQLLKHRVSEAAAGQLLRGFSENPGAASDDSAAP